MRILVTTDFSPVAASTVRAAAQLAQKLRGSITIMHVLPAPDDDDASADEVTRYVAARKRLDAETVALARPGIDVHGEITVGFTDEAIESHLRHGATDLLVVGATTDERARAQRLVELATCPVLMVGEGNALGDALEVSRPLRVLVAVDRTEASDQPLVWLGKLRAKTPCDVTVMYAYWPLTEHARLGVPVTADMFAPHPAVVAVLEREIAARARELAGEGAFHVRCYPGIGAVADLINTAASEIKADLVVVGAHRRAGWDRLMHASASRGVLFDSVRPVVCVAHDLFPRTVRKQIRKVLVATDLTPEGNHAVSTALDLMQLDGPDARVDLVHVRTGATAHLANDRVVAQLEALIPPHLDRDVVSVRCFAIDGDAIAKTLLQTAARWNVDAICLGSRRHGIGRALYGSVAAELVEHASIPVLVARARPV